MTCFTPIQGFETARLTVNGKRGFTLNPKVAFRRNGTLVERITRCRKCEGCRFDYSREWAVKLSHESEFHDDLSFITLTYSDEFIPCFGALDYAVHWTNFLKRFREKIYPQKIRFYMIGEYGELKLRPHYHAIIFGYDFLDKCLFKREHGQALYTSKLLDSLWSVPRGQPNAGRKLGHASVGSVEYASLAYVARYSMKKLIGNQYDGFESLTDDETGEIITRPSLSKRYIRFNQETGEQVSVPTEHALMSRMPGIVRAWFDKYNDDVYRQYDNGTFKDGIHLDNGFFVRPPSYYDNLLLKINPDLLEKIKLSRQDNMSANASEFTPERLAQKRLCLLGKLSKLKRNLQYSY